MTDTAIGSLGSPWLATVDDHGVVHTRDCTLDWWIAAEDGWHFASTEPAARIRQSRVDATPVVLSSIRVPGGDAIATAYACIIDGENLAVVEVENGSKVPFAVAFAVSGRRPRIRLPRPPARTDVPADAGAPAAGEVFVFPVPHTARVRVAVPIEPVRRGRSGVLPASVPSPLDVAKGWIAHREKGVRVVVPDPRRQQDIEYAQCLDLIDPAGDHDAWTEDFWRDSRKGVALLPSVPDEWLGQGVEVHDAPTRHGTLSFAVRWHGARPALLWDLTGSRRPVTLTAPALDPSWSTTEAKGEALLEPVLPPGGLPKVYGVEAPDGEPAPAVGESFQ